MVDGKTEMLGRVESAYFPVKTSGSNSGRNFPREVTSKFALLSTNVVGMSDISLRGMTCDSLSPAFGMACERKKMGVAKDTGLGQKEVGGDKGKHEGKDYGGEPTFGQVGGILYPIRMWVGS